MLQKYSVCFKVTNYHVFIVEASSEEEAEDLAQKMVDGGDTSYRTIIGDQELDNEMTSIV